MGGMSGTLPKAEMPDREIWGRRDCAIENACVKSPMGRPGLTGKFRVNSVSENADCGGGDRTRKVR